MPRLRKDYFQEAYWRGLPAGQQERKKMKNTENKCWWCKNYGSVPLRVFTEHGCQSITVKYCPLCGKKIKEKQNARK